MNFQNLKDLTWKEVVLLLGLIGGVLLARKYVGEAVGDVSLIVVTVLAWLKQSSPPSLSPTPVPPVAPPSGS